MNTESRYIRQTNLPQIGDDGQKKLKAASVLIIGAGGLGHALLPYLAGAGIGVLGVMDGDWVSMSNLHRQILFRESDIGKNKADVIKKRLKDLNTDINVQSFNEYLTAENAIDYFNKFDLIVDATDHITARYLINDACVLTGKPFIHAAIYRFQVQVSVFNYRGGPTYRCLYPKAPVSTQSCAEAGVMGTTVAHAGSLQANEVIKVILGIGEVLSGKLLIADLLTGEHTIFGFKKNNALKITRQLYEQEHHAIEPSVCFVSTPGEIKDKKVENVVYLDVRQPDELPQVKGENVIQIPLGLLSEHLSRLSKDADYYVFCQSGKRSRRAVKLLKDNAFKRVFHLSENAKELKELL